MDTKRLQALPLGRPPKFREPVTLPPFTAERKLLVAITRLMRHHKTTKSEIMRRAITAGLKQMLREMKAEVDA